MGVYITADPGSCHGGEIKYAKMLIQSAKDSGANAIKFQLFKNSPGNIALPYEWWPELVYCAKETKIDIYASVWDKEGVELLVNSGCDRIKFAYSQRNNYKELLGNRLDFFKQIFISGGIMDSKPVINNLVWYYCLPFYPFDFVPDFDGRFPLFDGFSDHTIGKKAAIRAVNLGAKYIEKHIRLDEKYSTGCPDEKFAMKPLDFRTFVSDIGWLE